MDHGEQSQGNKKKKTHSMSALTLSTMSKLAQNRRRAVNPGTKCTIHDNSSPGYGWLLPGWLAEERLMESGRIYRYYYDPSGHLYRSQHEVINAWEELGVIVIDK